MTTADAEFGRGAQGNSFEPPAELNPESEELHIPSPKVLFTCVEQNAFEFRGARRLQR